MVGAIPRLIVVRLSRKVMMMAMHTKHIMLDHVDQIVEYCGCGGGWRERVYQSRSSRVQRTATGHLDLCHSCKATLMFCHMLMPS